MGYGAYIDAIKRGLASRGCGKGRKYEVAFEAAKKGTCYNIGGRLAHRIANVSLEHIVVAGLFT